jgi:flagellar hook protein FlgE
MSSTFSIALSGLQAEGQAISTTGNNLANMTTDGFKSSTVDFKTLISEQLGSYQSGLGVGPAFTNQNFAQGAIQTSTSPLAVAVQGNGFFVVNSPANLQEFTRDGNFQLSADGVLQTQTGETVQGWSATAAGLDTTGAISGITLPLGATLAATPTANFSINANLDSTETTAGTGNTYSVPMQVFDSLGDTHTLSLNFVQSTTTANTWSYTVTIPSSDVGGTAGTQTAVAVPGNITFNSDGSMSAATVSPVAISVAPLADGAAPLNMNWNLFTSGVGDLTQYAEASGLASSTQDGKQAAQLTTVAIQSGGQVLATFSNGVQKVEAQLAMASILNPNSLQNVGNNNLAITSSSATPAIGLPQTGSRGQILGSSLESSNVDMATEFTNLIVYQSAYQADSKVITTGNNMVQALLTLIT